METTTPITCSDSYDHQNTQESCIRGHIIACGGGADHKDKGVAMASFETSYRGKLTPRPSVVIPATPAAARGGSNKRALLCGVTYSHEHRYKLKGTANDVSNMKNLLTNTFGYPAECIRILSEDDPFAQDLIPTKKNIENSLKWLVEGCKWGDSLVFYFSGHGLRQPDFQNVDFLKEGMILDNDINKTIVWPLKAGVRLHAIVDACHNGTILDLEHVYNRKQRTWINNLPPSGARKSTSGGLAISISACEDDKMAADTTRKMDQVKDHKESTSTQNHTECPDLARLAPPRSALQRFVTPPYVFPALNVQLAKQPTTSGIFLPPHSEARFDASESMPLKTLCLYMTQEP
ncbi:unnamed protein product [Prunus armeniaca]|uniref:Peptidase C14 caspase domain-containing protein n=1 Tax=Prunus armeniaca TaxID=36596 RepID=A0A6J5Y2I2_PRUAR|nr:unnamed protein product [Prunus armeniaca]